MSHLAMQKTEPGQPLFVDKTCLARAANMLGLEVIETNKYHWYGRSVGDYPLPEGMTTDQLGKNAKFVLRVKEPRRSELKERHGEMPYDVGIVEDPNNPGCFLPIFDFFVGGFGLTECIGEPLRDAKGNILALTPKLKQYYDMACDAAAAAEAGDSIELLTLRDASIKYPEQFQPSKDADTWVSIVDETQRMGAFT